MNRPTGHRIATLRNLAKALIEHGRIETTVTKAKLLRPFVESIVTMGRKGTLHHRRLAFARLNDKRAVHKVFETIAPLFAGRDGGYTRIIRTRRRAGDAAELAIIEFVEWAEDGESTLREEKPAEEESPQEEARDEAGEEAGEEASEPTRS